MNRRKVLKIAGATVVMAGGAVTWRAFDQGVFSAGSGAAYEPWKNWLAVQPLNQMSERADRERQLGIEPRFGTTLKELVGDANSQALMPFRIGYPIAEAKPSPRRALNSVLM